MLKLRKIELNDLKDVFHWKNSPQSRLNSLNQKKISFVRHSTWFYKQINKKNSFSFIAILNRAKVGIVSYQKYKSGKYFVSINLNPIYRNKGLGKKILIMSQLQDDILKNCKVLYARIRRNNFSSLNIFENANYRLMRKYKAYYLFYNNKLHDNNDNMKKNKNFNKYSKIIDQIELIRSKNNGNWMSILRIAFQYSPKETAKVMSKIYKEDQKISKLAKKLDS